MIEIFGMVAISIMVASYAFEKLSPIFIATFSLGCALAAVYAYLLESYPFFLRGNYLVGRSFRSIPINDQTPAIRGLALENSVTRTYRGEDSFSLF